ncbi:MAG TPA: bifunctional lysine ketoglutarate reductase /saccharopine dehydrogenase family protein [Bacteroidales bacterium]|nr:bifunctional lysine ketoglutarate reductase /saccharopine dehydrogenase family protein [Bacteroidales bacterium]
MRPLIGIREEDKYTLERRSAISPKVVEKLTKSQHFHFVVQSSKKRIFSDEEYRKAGATISNDLKDCQVVFGIKEIPEKSLEPEKTYVFFSHVIKGQPHNMPMLKRMMELRCNLIDYERVADEQNKRLIYFGNYAGLAGMINTFWSLGLRLREYGFHDNPFLEVMQAHHYPSLADARKHLSAVARNIIEKGLPEDLVPFTIGFTGYGNVSSGAKEIANLFPGIEIDPEELPKLCRFKNLPNNLIYKVTFKEKDLSRHKEGKPFDLDEYYSHPEKYENNFETYLPHLSVLLNGIYWDSRYPRIVTRNYLEKAFGHGRPKLVVIGDVSCDPNGSVELTHKGTTIDDPVFVYNPYTRKPTMGFKGEGMLVMAVDILPSELPRDSSEFFSRVLSKFVESIVMANYNAPYEEINLPDPLKKALILHNGRLTPPYQYLEKYINISS